MGEVKAEVVRSHEGTFLLHVGAQHHAEGLVQQVGAGVVVLDVAAAHIVHHQGEGLRALRRKALGQVDGEVVLLHGVQDLDAFPVLALNVAGITYLAAHLGIERRAVKDQLEVFLVLLLYGALFQEVRPFHAQGIIALEEDVRLLEHHPVAKLVGSGVAGAFLLLSKLHVEAFQVHCIAFFGGDEFREVDGEAVSVVQHKGIGPGNHLGGGVFVHVVFQHADAAVQGAQESVFFFLDYAGDEFLLGLELRIGASHIGHQLGDEAAQEGLREAQEGVAVADGAAEDAANHVAGLHVGRQLAVGNGEGDGADVVCNYAHGHLDVAAFLVFVAAEGFHLADEAGENVCLVVALLVLQDHAQALEAHAGVDVLGGQRLQVAVGLALVLHEHQVPDFDDIVIVRVHQLAAGNFGNLLVRTKVDVDFRAGAAGAGIAHFPEVVVLVAGEHMVLRQVLEPGLEGLGVQFRSVFFGALENGGVQFGLVNLVHLREQLPGPIDGLFLEVVAKTPVAQHLEHGVVPAVVAHGFQVVVLAAHTEALLGVRGSGELGGAVAQENVLELVHARIGEHERGVILDDHGGRGHYRVPLGGEKVQILLADFIRCHIFISK